MAAMRLALAPLVLLAACASSGLDLRHDFDPTVDFSGLKTYAWLEPTKEKKRNPRVDNALVKGRIVRAVEAELAAKGFQKTTGKPDFYVGYHAAVETRVQIENINAYYEYSHGWGWEYGLHDPGYGMEGVRTQERMTREYEQGSLIIDISEPTKKSLIWRGAAQAEMNEKATPEEREAGVRDAVTQILAPFPPKPGENP